VGFLIGRTYARIDSEQAKGTTDIALLPARQVHDFKNGRRRHLVGMHWKLAGDSSLR
jgi:hypothetical protein